MHKAKMLQIVLVTLGAIALVSALLFTFTLKGVSASTRSTNDTSTPYWDSSQGPCSDNNRTQKRPVVEIRTLTGLYLTALIGAGEISRSESDISRWKELQGNCPYQVMDIYRLAASYDLYALAILFGTSGLYVGKIGRKY